MIRCLFLFAAAAFPALVSAETPDERLDRHCRTLWEEIAAVPDLDSVTGNYEGLSEGWCRFTDLAMAGPQARMTFRIAELHLRGYALGYIAANEVPVAPGMLFEARVEGFRMAATIGQPQTDWLFAAQSKTALIDAEISLDWDMAAKALILSKLVVDFPGDNLVSATARVENVDLSSDAAMQMSAAGFAVTDVALDVAMHGLFETYLLLPLGAAMLPYEGDMDAAAANLRTTALTGLAALPDAAFPAATKDALARFLTALPNPWGELSVKFRADPGYGPVRLGSIAMTGVPQTMADAEMLFQGIGLDVAWTETESE